MNFEEIIVKYLKRNEWTQEFDFFTFLGFSGTIPTSFVGQTQKGRKLEILKEMIEKGTILNEERNGIQYFKASGCEKTPNNKKIRGA